MQNLTLPEKKEYLELLEKKALIKLKRSLKESLLDFTIYFYKELRGTDFIVNFHHEIICDNLQKVEDYELIFLNINIPPRFSKTELAAINFIARGLANNPKANYLYITSSDELRSETSVRIRDIISCEKYKEYFDVELKKDQKAKNLWRTDQGGGLKTATIFGQITGFGAGQMIEINEDLEDYIRDFEGCIVLDDINKISDSEDLNMKNTKANEIIFSTILSRKNSKDTPIINIQQRAGLEDATSVLLKFYENNNKSKNLVLPVIYNDKPLWEWKLNIDDINELKDSSETSHTFDTQYMQDPKQLKGLVFPESELKRFKLSDLNNGIEYERTSAIDTADEGTDFYSHVDSLKDKNKVYIIDVVFNKENLKINKPLSEAQFSKNRIENCIIETNKEGSLYISGLTDDNPNVSFYGKWNSTKKLTRILVQSGWITEYCYFRTDYEKGSAYDKFMKNLTSFLKESTNKNDDAPDSLALLAWYVRSILS